MASSSSQPAEPALVITSEASSITYLAAPSPNNARTRDELQNASEYLEMLTNVIEGNQHMIANHEPSSIRENKRVKNAAKALPKQIRERAWYEAEIRRLEALLNPIPEEEGNVGSRYLHIIKTLKNYDNRNADGSTIIINAPTVGETRRYYRDKIRDREEWQSQGYISDADDEAELHRERCLLKGLRLLFNALAEAEGRKVEKGDLYGEGDVDFNQKGFSGRVPQWHKQRAECNYVMMTLGTCFRTR